MIKLLLLSSILLLLGCINLEADKNFKDVLNNPKKKIECSFDIELKNLPEIDTASAKLLINWNMMEFNYNLKVDKFYVTILEWEGYLDKDGKHKLIMSSPAMNKQELDTNKEEFFVLNNIIKTIYSEMGDTIKNSKTMKDVEVSTKNMIIKMFKDLPIGIDIMKSVNIKEVKCGVKNA